MSDPVLDFLAFCRRQAKRIKEDLDRHGEHVERIDRRDSAAKTVNPPAMERHGRESYALPIQRKPGAQ